MPRWFPDFCPDSDGVVRACKFDVSDDWMQCSGADLCPFHAGVAAANALSTQAIFDAVLQSSRVKEAARTTAKLQLALASNHPGIPYRVEADGSFRIGIESSVSNTGVKTWARMAGWPTQVAARTALTIAVNDAVALIRKPRGTSAVVTVD